MDTKRTNESATNLPVNLPVQPVKYRYIPEVGAHVKLRTWADYSSRGVSMWAHMQVLSVLPLTGNASDEFFNMIELEELNGSTPTGKTVRVPLSAIERPIGWSEVYDIHVSKEKLPTLLSWLDRGLSVRQSQYIGDGSVQYQPLDTDGTCNWKFGAVTDKVTLEQVKDRIRIVQVEYTYDAFVMRECRYCHGAGRREYPMDKGLKECHVCKGTGQAAKYFSEFDKKERKSVLAELSAQGFKVEWERRGQHWSMARETLVKDVGQDCMGMCECGQVANVHVLTDGGRVPMCKACASKAGAQ